MAVERSKVDIELRKLGFGGLDDPNLNQQIAFCIRDHAQFRNQLFSVEPLKRRLAYEQLRPHLRFTAKPLDVYEAEMRTMAEQQQLPTLREGEIYPQEFKVPELTLDQLATDAIEQNSHEKQGGLELVCTHCTVAEIFRAKLRKEAYKAAHSAGWRMAEKKAYCPQHIPNRCTMTLTCANCPREEKIRCWEPDDGYLKARLSGWVIKDSSFCPTCSSVPDRLQ